ncbi:MAG: hypothetical protein N2510_03935, partial [Ignavibacteria bacterium]|nr:hypothetical protein [Ignavibacteria bacterium]
MSDLQTLKIAEEYAKHPLLKNFSIPRMKIEDVEMTIPLAIDSIGRSVDLGRLKELVYKTIITELNLSNLKKETNDKILNKIEDELKNFVNMSTDIKQITANITHTIRSLWAEFPRTRGSLAENNRKKALEVLPAKLEEIIKSEIGLKGEKEEDMKELNVIVESQRLKEIKPENIIQIKLK